MGDLEEVSPILKRCHQLQPSPAPAAPQAPLTPTAPLKEELPVIVQLGSTTQNSLSSHDLDIQVC